uniref:Uncharacterized protein n=1 Tax=Arundo donax TaxID=35708 RepID=A0A0A9HNV7_ARUDO
MSTQCINQSVVTFPFAILFYTILKEYTDSTV